MMFQNREERQSILFLGYCLVAFLGWIFVSLTFLSILQTILLYVLLGIPASLYMITAICRTWKGDFDDAGIQRIDGRIRITHPLKFLFLVFVCSLFIVPGTLLFILR